MFNKYLEDIQVRPRMVDMKWSDKSEQILKAIVMTLCPNFKFTSELEKLYIDIAKYFCGDSSVYDTEKGLYLYGKYGVGKTLLFKVMSKFIAHGDNYFVKITADRLSDLFQKEGFELFERIAAISNNDTLRLRPLNLFIDDVGQGARTVKYYGSETNPMIELLQRRYRVYTDAYKLTHVSTNLEPTEIKDLYGEYINSRFKEMFNVILMPGKDMRK